MAATHLLQPATAHRNGYLSPVCYKLSPLVSETECMSWESWEGWRWSIRLAANTCQIQNIRVTEEVCGFACISWGSGDYLIMIQSYDLSQCSHLVVIEVAYLRSMKATTGLRFVRVFAPPILISLY